ncbi:hypothetical protein [Pengzhenrongella sp.]|jgi:hypothetical protein|uniref:hypothetical protein n=1 Tax=Pengzhenrongella sp. TaxID=2888820 RepID=UPI002F94792A
MPLFAHPNALPPAVRSRLVLAHGDRVIASGEITGGWAIASRLALYAAGSDGKILRRPWSDVDRASLDADTQTITVVWVDGGTLDLPLVDHRHPAFARALRERVQSSVVHGETVKLPHGRQVRVALRRGEDGLLFSQVIGNTQVDLADPAIAALVEAAEARVRGAAGLPL